MTLRPFPPTSHILLTLSLLATTPVMAKPAMKKTGDEAAAERAMATVKNMRPEEKTILTHGILAVEGLYPGFKLPVEAVFGAGYVDGIPRLGVPSLRETDASLGVAWLMGARKDGATALPSGLAQASSWNPELLRKGGAMIGSEARAKGFNVMLAGGANLIREPREGRTFEYFSEDPLLTGTLAGAAIDGIQSNHIISTIKHFAVNAQETGRFIADSQIGEAAARESDLLAFQIGIEQGKPGSVMCAYNRVNGVYSCGNDWLLNKVLKQDWRYNGFVMSDWGAVPSLLAASNGLDQQSGKQLDRKDFFGKPLAEAAASNPAMSARLDDMNRRVLTAIYANALDTNPAVRGGTINFAANAEIALEVAKQGIVLLKNAGDVLPLAKTVGSIAIIGGHADTGVLSGGGSSQVDGPAGPALAIPNGGEGAFALFSQQHYHSSAPLKAIKARSSAKVAYHDGHYLTDAVLAAKKADIAIVFATSWRTEGSDVPDLSLPDGQDELIAAVTAANPRTIVVLETGGPVQMPWLDQAAAVIAAWYPGAKGGEAIASVLFGETNPSGHLPVTFPASLDQLPRPKLDGMGEVLSSMMPGTHDDVKLPIDYNIEGSDVGYRWNAHKGYKSLFPFGYGLSYTSFSTSGLKLSGYSAKFSVSNTGKRDGATVAQLYLVSRNGAGKQRLAGYQRVELAAGETKQVSLTIDPRLLADWRDGGWSIDGGTYGFALGSDAERLGPVVTTRQSARKWRD